MLPVLVSNTQLVQAVVLFCLMNNVQKPGFQSGMGRGCIYICIFCYTFYSYKEITVQ